MLRHTKFFNFSNFLENLKHDNNSGDKLINKTQHKEKTKTNKDYLFFLKLIFHKSPVVAINMFRLTHFACNSIVIMMHYYISTIFTFDILKQNAFNSNKNHSFLIF